MAISSNFSMTRKIFRFFKHKGVISSIRSGLLRLKQLFSKFDQTLKHQRSIRQEFFGSKVELDQLETIQEEKSQTSEHERRQSILSDLQPEEAELRIIKNPEFIDSKTQLVLRIIHEALGITADVFELTYYIFDHLSFLGKIEVIQNKNTKKVARCNERRWGPLRTFAGCMKRFRPSSGRFCSGSF